MKGLSEVLIILERNLVRTEIKQRMRMAGNVTGRKKNRVEFEQDR